MYRLLDRDKTPHLVDGDSHTMFTGYRVHIIRKAFREPEEGILRWWFDRFT
jgi:hypothetical protein